MISSEDERKALVAQRGLALLLAAGGLMLGWNGLHGDSLIARCGLGALMFAVGIGIFLYWRWARWMALGACFLVIAGACVVPVLLLLVVPFEGEFDGSMRVNVLWSVVALAFGTIGYKGLAYFRSESGRLEFAAESATAHQDLFNVASPDRKDDLLGETSSTVLVSAGVWVLVLLIAELLGLGKPDWLLAHKRPERPWVAPTMPPQEDVSWYEVSRDPASLTGNSSPAVKNRVLPDLIPLGLCFRDVASGRQIEMVYANVGGGSGYQRFHYGMRARSADRPSRRDLELTVPEPDALLTVRNGAIPTTGSGYTWVDLDIDHEIVESDETNNSARFMVPHDADGNIALPACKNARLRIVPQAGPVRTVSTTNAPPELPDLVPLGLCARGNVLIGLQFTNHGAYARGLYQISQGQDGGTLRVVDQAYLSVPAPYEAMGFNVGVVPLLVGKRGQSANIMVKIDALNEIQESNKLNNVTSARVTRLADGSVDLPPCDEVEKHADDPQWMDKGIVSALQTAPQPAKPRTGRLPDFVALGACMSREPGSLGFKVVFGNVGRVAHSVAFELREEYGGNGSRWRLEAGTLQPGELHSHYFYFSTTDKRFVLTIDGDDKVAELDESNNFLIFDIKGRPEGGFNWPDCPQQLKQVADWEAMMRARKGN